MAKVWLSNSRCIFENLALEQWLLNNWSTDALSDVLLAWRNRPAVVIGRHQNPWREADVGFLNAANVQLVRRHSGGGTVYHDEGNINFSFFTSNQRHSRLANLQLIVGAVHSVCGLRLQVNAKHDLLMQGGYKVSGTAARLTSKAAYHHLTLMVRVDVQRLERALRPCLADVHTKATDSLRSPVKTLSHACHDLQEAQTIEAVANHYRLLYNHCDIETIDRVEERHFPGVTKLLSELHSWKWKFGKTPKFHIHRTLPSGRRLSVGVDKGLVETVSVEGGDQAKLAKVNGVFENREFDLQLLQVILAAVIQDGL